MLDLLNKILSAGLETQDKVIDFLDELVRKGKIDEKEREKFVEDLDKKILSARDKGEALVNDTLDKISEKNPLATKSDLDALERKVKSLEKRLKKLEGPKTTKSKSTTAKKTTTEGKTEG